MAKKHSVTLTDDERARLQQRISSGAAPAGVQTHARILLKTDAGPGGPAWTDRAIAAALEVSVPTVGRVRRRFADQGRRRPSGGAAGPGSAVDGDLDPQGDFALDLDRPAIQLAGLPGQPGG